MNGIEASLKIRSDKNNLNQNSAIIAFTANANEFDSTKCMEAGMNDVITKPFELKVLIEKIYKFSNNSTHNI
jgi:CheY-like chemotaxis protein